MAYIYIYINTITDVLVLNPGSHTIVCTTQCSIRAYEIFREKSGKEFLEGYHFSIAFLLL